MNNEMRVQKFLSQSGICSRRRAEELMLAGRVKINGSVCKELGTKIDPEKDKVEVDGKAVAAATSFIYLLVNKPSSYITSLYDPEGRPLVTDLLPKSMPRVWPVGRLDWDTEGLLIMTNDGKLTNLMTHPSHEVPKTYAVKVRGQIGERDEVLDKLREGVEIEPGETTAPALVRVNYDNGNNTWLEMTITEGKNRQVRRMWDAVEYPVMKLRRISMGTITIDGLPSGAYRTLTHAEVAELYGKLDAVLPELARPTKRDKKREREDLERNVKPRAHFSETTKRRFTRSNAAREENNADSETEITTQTRKSTRKTANRPQKVRESVHPRAFSKSGSQKSSARAGKQKFGQYKPAEQQEERKPYDKKAHFQINPITGEKVVRAKRGYRPVDSVEGDRAARGRRGQSDSTPATSHHDAPQAGDKKHEEKKRDYKSAKDLRPGQSAPKGRRPQKDSPAPKDSHKRDSKSGTKKHAGKSKPKNARGASKKPSKK